MSYQKIQMFFFLGLLLGIAALTFYLFLPYLGSLVLGLTFAIIFRPVYEKLLRWFRGKEVFAALLTTALLVLIVLIPFIFIGARLFAEASALLAAVSGGEGGEFARVFAESLQERFKDLIPVSSEEISAQLNEYVRNVLDWLVRNFGSIFSGVAKIFFALFLSLFTFYYLLKDGHKLKEVIVAISPLANKYDREIFGKLYAVVNSVIKGSLVVAILQGILIGIGFGILGVPSPFLWGSVGVVAALLPIVGTAVITLPGALYLFLAGKTISAVALLVWAGVIVGMVDNFLRPKLIERGVDIHPLLILLSVLGGVEAFGPMGFVIGPLVLSLLFALIDIYQREFQEYLRAES